MKEEMKQLAETLWDNHRCKTCGLVLGIFLGIAILLFGFLNTVFVLVCGMLGLFIGVKLDKGESLVDRLDRIFPNRFQRR